MAPLRVDLVSEHASPLAALGERDAGGQNVYVAALARELGRLGCRVTVFTRRTDPATPTRVPLAPNVAVEHVDAGPPQPIPKDELFQHMPDFAAHLRERWLTTHPDVVHTHFWMSGWATALAGVWAPHVHTYHALGVVKARHQGDADTSPGHRQVIESALLRLVDQVVATCEDEVDELTALGADLDRVTVVPCGIDPALFGPRGTIAPRGPAADRIVVVSRLVPRKGIDDVIRALALLGDVELVVVGGPPAPAIHADPEVRRLRGVAVDCGVGDRVEFLGGIARELVPAVLRSADVVVSTPWYEPFGIVPLEAMACGVPVVGSAVGGLLDTVRHERTGILVPPRQPAGIAAAVDRLLANPSLRRRLGLEAAAVVRERFTWKQVAASMLDVYRDLARRSERLAASA
jgi:D-inositol-3-phosphate glycosyltransferase